MTATRFCLIAGCLVSGGFAAAQSPRDTTTLDRVLVASARHGDADVFDAPASIAVIDLDDDDRAAANIAASLAGVPGVLARDRRNTAQDTQLSIRGFGARSTFGVRGLRLYADGIPATMPDGQGQVSHFSLLAGDRIEVMRGPFSALYGNSAGGVVRIDSADGGDGLDVLTQASVSADGRAAGARLLGGRNGVGFNVAASVADIDGWRDHSAARRESANAKLRLDTWLGGALDVVLNHYAAPHAQDPLGLARDEAFDRPRRVTPAALAFDTRKSTRQDQLGAVLDQPLGHGHAVRVMAYAGQRSITQFLAVPVAAQASPLSAGGVVDLDGTYGGGDARWSWHGEVAGHALDVAAGIAADAQRQHRRGYENHVGDALGVRGTLRRDERNLAGNVDRYAQAWWALAPRWSLLAGVRRSEVRLESIDRYVTAANPDDSGRADYARTTPVAGLAFAPNARWRWYLSAGRGFETPTLNELGYRADGGAGLAFDLRPATSRNAEFGMKWRGQDGATVEAAMFRAATDDELAVARNVGGRSSYRNAGRALRQGVEIAATLPIANAWQLSIAHTWLDATFRDGFAICATAGCATPTARVAAGTRIPGTTRTQLAARLRWQEGAWSASAQALAVGRVTVNDTGDAWAPGHALVDLEAAREWRAGDGRLRLFARIDNALDRRYVGSVIVNEGNGRYFEPGPDRTWLAGAQWNWR